MPVALDKMGIQIFSLFLHKNICYGYSIAATWHGASDEYRNISFCGEIRNMSL